jgi:isopentenyl-diphosphate Delta-isomerase
MATSAKTTDPQEELLVQVDEENNIIGSIARRDAHQTAGVFYRTIFVLIKNSDGEVLLQRRSPTKDLYPNCWDLSVGGHVNYGKTYLETAAREVSEEMGINIDETELTFKGEVLVNLPKSGEYFHVFEYQIKPGEKIEAAQEEVSDTKWMKIEDIKQSMADKTLSWYPRPEQVIAALY